MESDDEADVRSSKWNRKAAGQGGDVRAPRRVVATPDVSTASVMQEIARCRGRTKASTAEAGVLPAKRQEHGDSHHLRSVRVVVEGPSLPSGGELLTGHAQIVPGGPVEQGATLFGSHLPNLHLVNGLCHKVCTPLVTRR